MDDFTVEDWPDTVPGDLADVSVELRADGFGEAVKLTLAQ